MSVIISGVEKHSPAAKKGIKSGFVLNSINEHEINDVLDYRFYLSDDRLVLRFTDLKGQEKIVKFKNLDEIDLGLNFDTYLMDKQRHCKNKCIFCFIDQLPKGMRDTLYFKDDDSRLSFLFGNYITLTNLTQYDVDRIIQMHISPINVSIHTMDPILRVKMMSNKNAGESLKYLMDFAKAGIKLNAQLVLCPGINDGDNLKYSLNCLSKLYPALQSVAVVPVGLTKYRSGLAKLNEYTSQTACDVINIVDDFAVEFKQKNGTRLVFCADEFYIKAEKRLPDEEYYEDYPQIENGVGLWRNLESEFFFALDAQNAYDDVKKTLSLATGTAAYPLMKRLTTEVSHKYKNININVYEIENDFFGHSITVAGLITGKDLISQLKGKPLGEKLLIPSVMLRSEGDIFLDDISLLQAQEALGVTIEPVENDGDKLLQAIIK